MEDNVDVVKLLLNHSKANNIDLNSTDNDGNTAFHDACIDGNVNVVKLLLTNAKEKEITIPKAEKIEE